MNWIKLTIVKDDWSRTYRVKYFSLLNWKIKFQRTNSGIDEIIKIDYTIDKIYARNKLLTF